MDVTLHIGRHKTGSTAIQVYCVKNAERLAQQGVLYPQAGRPDIAPNGHHQLAWDLAKDGLNSTAFQALRDELEGSDCHHAIISSECFDELAPDHIATFAEFLKDHRVRIVVYLRNQVEAMESMYRTNVTHYAKAEEFRAYLRRERRNYDYRQFLMAWSKTFGKDCLNVHLYDTRFLRGGDVISDFFCYFPDLDTTKFERPQREINHGIPSPCVLAMVYLRQMGANEQTVSAFRQWSYKKAEDYTQLFTFLSAHEAQEEYNRFSESNSWLKEKYFPNVHTEDILKPLILPEARNFPARDVGRVLSAFIVYRQ